MNRGGTEERVTDPWAGTWDYGDFPYGLELLTLPPIGHASAADPGLPCLLPDCDPGVVLPRLRPLAAGGAPPGTGAGDAEPTVDQLYWFRWITGHQTTFLIWRLMGRILDRHSVAEPLDDDALARLTTFVRGYCAMLLYTGSCPRAVYQDLIRPRMFLQHRSFSGTWSPDYAPVRGVFRGRGPVLTNSPAAAELARAVDLHRTIHEGIAARLVPEGESLLQQAIEQVAVRPSPRTALLYDNFFLTMRADVGERELTAQLLRRLLPVALDLEQHGLHPGGLPDAERPQHLRDPAVTRCEEQVGQVLHQVGEAAVDATRLAARA
ncbi:hypothetical protein ABH931_006605 [Streptacidiphilus sp. MAP12-33]|uniref:L-tyrosine 3-hydroxylase n=1 Tax=Streptacidiphilus sp. MAP12-33 TaxID=3156266 RepID=UPI003516B252